MIHSKEIVPVNIEDEMKTSYLDYAMSVIVGRALPDVRDGLKPVHRRILYAMFREGLLSSRRYSKCAGVVGEVLKKYHPHGDSAVYDTLVRLAQKWNMRYPLIDGQGNFGSVDGDPAAAYRYTECRLMALAEEMMADIDKNTVDFTPNFDDSTTEPLVLPTKVPNLLINGSDGIAVGMATKIPPHNLREIVDALIALIERSDLTTADLVKIVPGPDFPTGAFIFGGEGIRQAYETGRGVIQMRAKVAIEPMKGEREAIIVSEIPYQVNKARIIEAIAALVEEQRIEGISDVRDESDRHGMRVVIELKRGVVSDVVLNQLYKHTALQSSFGIIMLTIVAGQPRVIGLAEALRLFISHRREVVVRRITFELEEALKHAHILEGLKIAVENIDEVIALVKGSPNPPEAKRQLIMQFGLTEIQAQAILDMRLQRLTGLERDKIIEEYNEVLVVIAKLREILASDAMIFKVIKEELIEIREKYGDPRRSQIISGSVETFSVEDLIQEEEMVVTVSHLGYIKRNAIGTYRAQNRGGRGKQGMTTREEDFVEQLFVASTHNYILVFTNQGRVYWLKVHEIPLAGRATKGRMITNLIAFSSEEKVAAILPVKSFEEGHYVVFVTRQGTIKKTSLFAYARPRNGGIIALTIEPGDELKEVVVTDGAEDIMISTREGQTIRFNNGDVRPMGRGATGVRGISLVETDAVVGMSLVQPQSYFSSKVAAQGLVTTSTSPAKAGQMEVERALVHEKAVLLTVSAKGYGKRTEVAEYRVQGRGGSGIITMKTTDKTGPVVATLQVSESDDIMIITNFGKIIRLHASQISVIGRNTQGVRLIQMEPEETVVSVAKVAEQEEDSALANETL